jgi:predicted SprT family Zn-dependent metalloprotease
MEKLPEPLREILWSKINDLNITLEFSEHRNTKYGEWRLFNGKQTISINYNLHPLQFFLTLTHEIAHSITWNMYGNLAKPHGKEWKQNYRNIVLPLMNKGFFSKEVEKVIIEHMKNPPACAGTCSEITKIINPSVNLVKDVPVGTMFPYRGNFLVKLHKKRTRWVCNDASGRSYLIPESSKVF